MLNNRLPSAVLAAFAAALVAGCSKSAAVPHVRADPAVPVVVAAVERRTVPLTLRAVGSVEPVASVAIVPRVDGPIERVLVADGQDVKAGQPLIQLDPQPSRLQVRVSQANLDRDVAKQADARAKEARGRALLAQHFISGGDYEQLKSNLDSAVATVAADRAALDQAKLQLGYTTIRAPVAGKIGHIALQTGNVVRTTSTEPLTTLNALDQVDVSFTVPEQNLQAVRRAAAAHEATVAVAASPRTLTGALSFIDNTVDRTSGTIRLRARIANTDRTLWPGEFVTVTLAIGSDAGAIVVPNVAVQQGPDGPYVFIVRADLVVEQRAVQIARIADDVAVIAGVQPGERVVVDGQSRLTPGTHVSIRSPPAKDVAAAT
jgi:multidrug efflux system membrane fusion protein